MCVCVPLIDAFLVYFLLVYSFVFCSKFACLPYGFLSQVGFNKGDKTTFYSFPESKTVNLTLLNSTSNFGRPGFFLFR